MWVPMGISIFSYMPGGGGVGSNLVSTMPVCMCPGGGGGGGGGALILVLGTHCKTDSWSCGCRLEKRGLSQTQDLSEEGLSEGHLIPVGAVVVSLASPRKASLISRN